MGSLPLLLLAVWPLRLAGTMPIPEPGWEVQASCSSVTSEPSCPTCQSSPPGIRTPRYFQTQVFPVQRRKKVGFPTSHSASLAVWAFTGNFLVPPKGRLWLGATPTDWKPGRKRRCCMFLNCVIPFSEKLQLLCFEMRQYLKRLNILAKEKLVSHHSLWKESKIAVEVSQVWQADWQVFQQNYFQGKYLFLSFLNKICVFSCEVKHPKLF